jgi:hypothetical protein
MDPATIIAAVQAASLLIEQGSKLMEERRRKRELTVEEEQAWDQYVAAQVKKPHWRPSTAPPTA